MTYPLHHVKWNDRLAFDMALTLEGSGETLQEILERYHLTVDDIVAFKSDPVFLKKVEHYRNEIRDKGLTFRLKARAQAEELLTTSWLLIHDSAVSPAVKADLIKSTVRWAGLDTPKDSSTTSNGDSGVKIVINLGDMANPHSTHTIEAPLYEPLREEEEEEGEGGEGDVC